MGKRLCAALAAVMLALGVCGCREADRVSHNVSVEADNFNVERRITVFNVRTDKVLWQMTGTFSVQSSDGDLDIIVELPDHTYAKHFFDLNAWTTYIIEDLSGSNVPKYSYELNFLPETLMPIKITSND
jgi:hypothetical protein